MPPADAPTPTTTSPSLCDDLVADSPVLDINASLGR